MRTLFSLVAAVSLASLASAQTWTWEPGPAVVGVAPVPANWTSVNNSVGGPGGVPNWGIRNDTIVFPAFSGSTFAWANFNSATGANDISNYLISPLVTFKNGDTISFFTRTVAAPAFPDRLELVFNTTGSTLPADFTNVLLTVNPTLTTTGYPTAWTQFTATISGLASPTIGRYAFHYNPTNGGPAGANSDFIGVDEVVFTPIGGGLPATNDRIGQGCYERFASFYELFAAGATDLSNTSWTLTQNASGGYDVVPGGVPFSAPSATATQVALGDDTSSPVGTLGLVVGSNGWVASGAGNDVGFAPTVATMLANPAAAFYFWHDMDPSQAGSGQVFYEENGATAVVTFNGVRDFNLTSINEIRVELVVAAPGLVPIMQVAFGALSNAGNGRLVGYSPAGASNNPGATDISAATLISVLGADAPALALTASTHPVRGTNWNLSVSNGALLDLVIIGLSDPNFADLGIIGLPGCGLRANLDLISVGSTFSLPVPISASLTGTQLFANGASLAPGVNAFGAITSNGIAGVVGDF